MGFQTDKNVKLFFCVFDSKIKTHQKDLSRLDGPLDGVVVGGGGGSGVGVMVSRP